VLVGTEPSQHTRTLLPSTDTRAALESLYTDGVKLVMALAETDSVSKPIASIVLFKVTVLVDDEPPLAINEVAIH